VSILIACECGRQYRNSTEAPPILGAEAVFRVWGPNLDGSRAARSAT